MSQGAHPTFFPSIVFIFGLEVESIKKLGGASISLGLLGVCNTFNDHTMDFFSKGFKFAYGVYFWDSLNLKNKSCWRPSKFFVHCNRRRNRSSFLAVV